MSAEGLLKEFKKCANDKERWQWVIDHQSNGVLVNLDNDDTFITIDGDECGHANFANFIGWAPGIPALLETMGIRAECV